MSEGQEGEGDRVSSPHSLWIRAVGSIQARTARWTISLRSCFSLFFQIVFFSVAFHSLKISSEDLSLFPTFCFYLALAAAHAELICLNCLHESTFHNNKKNLMLHWILIFLSLDE